MQQSATRGVFSCKPATTFPIPLFFRILFPTSTHFSSAPPFFNTRKPARVDYFGSKLARKTRGKSGERGKEIYCSLVDIDTLDGFELDLYEVLQFENIFGRCRKISVRLNFLLRNIDSLKKKKMFYLVFKVIKKIYTFIYIFKALILRVDFSGCQLIKEKIGLIIFYKRIISLINFIKIDGVLFGCIFSLDEMRRR